MKRGVIKVARRGFDVRYAEPKNLTIDSTKNHNKISMMGDGSVTFQPAVDWEADQRVWVDLVHNLGYQPFIKVWAKSPGTDWQENPVFNTGTTGPTAWVSGIERITDNAVRLYFYIRDMTLPAYSAFDVDYRYIIYTDPVKDPWYE